MTLIQIAVKGGWLMLVLLIISIVAIAIIIERLLKINKASLPNDIFLNEVKESVESKQMEKAIKLCENYPENPLANVLAKGIDAFSVNMDEVEKVVDTTAKSEIHKLEKNLGGLATIAAVAPLIGFLGTVTGMVKVFMNIESTGGGVDISLLAQGIWEALLTTVGGLTVGIIAILFYNYLVGRLETLAREIEDYVNHFLLDFRRKKNATKSR
ncbi:MAG: MotA/TolQ/ExbB proton channel family protein [Candidatus Cloacimonetes bacterium]|nr:MotA/TolQ/ExbB proton channel family protein [Candidatus Cloacimonadota bacterium]